MKAIKIGKRTIKTGLAVTLALIISNLFNLESPFFAAIAAIIAMQTSISESITMSKNRIVATLIGAIIALVFSYFIPFSNNPILIGLGVILIIYICIRLKSISALQLASMVFISIVLNQAEGNRLNYAFNRTLDTIIGVVIGTLVNYFIFPHKIAEKVELSFDKIYYELKHILELIVWDKEIDLKILRNDIYKIEDEYNIFKKDVKYTAEKMSFEFDLDAVFDIFETTYESISFLSTMKGHHIIDSYNKKALEEVFKKTIPLEDRDEEGIVNEKDIVFNYHLKEILSSLASISYILDLK